MYSEINTQYCDIQKIVLPLGKNIATNVSPSLPPINGSMCSDASQPGSLFVGNGTTWSQGTQLYDNLTDCNLMQAVGQPDIAGITTLVSITKGNPNTASLIINMPASSITTVGALSKTWSMTVQMDAKYRPLNDPVYFSSVAIVAGAQIGVVWTILGGVISITLPAAVPAGEVFFQPTFANYISQV